jgi:predicted Zn-dependent protease
MSMRIAILSPAECKAIFTKVESLSVGGGSTSISLFSRSSGTAAWARSQMRVRSEITELQLSVSRDIRGAFGSATTTRLDDDGLEQAVRAAEQAVTEDYEEPENIMDPLIDEPILQPTLWSRATLATSVEEMSDLARQMMAPAEAQGLLATGELTIGAEGHATMNSAGLFRYYPITDVRCSMTVRNKRGTGSGWGAGHHYDVAKLNFAEISARATQKCVRSQDPVALEPGRYTAILEPQAVADLFAPILERSGEPGRESYGFFRPSVEWGEGPFAKSPGHSKITEQVFDKRLTLSADPMDPDAGFVPFTPDRGDPYRPVTWIEKGILRALSYDRQYAVRRMGEARPLRNSLSYRLQGDGPTRTVEEMIASTERGILVTRFNNIQKVHSKSVLLTGFTRDGLWLIERGKITKAIKNFRFTESPLFVLNKLEAIGSPVRTFSPPFARMVPAIKVSDFSFTSLADAV